MSNPSTTDSETSKQDQNMKMAKNMKYIWLQLILVTAIWLPVTSTSSYSFSDGIYHTEGEVSHIDLDPYIPGNLLYSVDTTMYTTDFNTTTNITTIPDINEPNTTVFFQNFNNNTIVILLKPAGEIWMFERTTGRQQLLKKDSELISFATSFGLPMIALAKKDSVDIYSFMERNITRSIDKYQIQGASMLHFDGTSHIYAVDIHKEVHKMDVGDLTSNVILQLPEVKHITDLKPYNNYLLLLDKDGGDVIFLHKETGHNFTMNIGNQTQSNNSIFAPTTLVPQGGVLFVGGMNTIRCYEIILQSDQLWPLSCTDPRLSNLSLSYMETAVKPTAKPITMKAALSLTMPRQQTTLLTSTAELKLSTKQTTKYTTTQPSVQTQPLTTKELVTTKLVTTARTTPSTTALSTSPSTRLKIKAPLCLQNRSNPGNERVIMPIHGLVSHMILDPHNPGNILYSIENTIYATNFSSSDIVTRMNINGTEVAFEHYDSNIMVMLVKPSGDLWMLNRETGHKELLWNKTRFLSLAMDQNIHLILLAEENLVDLHPFTPQQGIKAFEMYKDDHHYQIRDSRLLYYDKDELSFYALDKNNTLYTAPIAYTSTDVVAHVELHRRIADMKPYSDFLMLLDNREELVIFINKSSLHNFTISLGNSCPSNPSSLVSLEDTLCVGGDNSIQCYEIVLETKELMPTCVLSAQDSPQDQSGDDSGGTWWIPLVAVLCALIIVAAIVVVVIVMLKSKKSRNNRHNGRHEQIEMIDIINSTNNVTSDLSFTSYGT